MFWPMLWLAVTSPSAPAASPPTALSPIQVQGRVIDSSELGATALDGDLIDRRGAQHPQELFTAVPGAWISRGSGQEHLSAIRSPVLNGAGACGAFLLLEDHIPVRPAGFCNVNGLFELDLRQAAAVQVLRGPGLAGHGANALHGVIDVATPDSPGASTFIEGGTNHYRRFGLSAVAGGWQLHGNLTRSDSFRDQESYRHAFIHGRHQREWSEGDSALSVVNTFTLVDLDQQTAGFIQGEAAYLDPQLRTSNANPEAFRDAYAVRGASHWSWRGTDGGQYRLVPFIRHSEQTFLQHFLPGQPLETNRQSSAGVQFSLSAPDWAPGLSFGVDVDGFHGELIEFQAQPVTTGSAFLRATRPQGLHYDYRVNGLSSALWGRHEWTWQSGLTLALGLRGEWLGYDYANRLSAGNLRDDGTPCGFGGCLYTRPADRQDDFLNLAPSLSLSAPAQFVPGGGRWHFRYARGFRPPQATELYRLQSGQTVADLDSEVIDAWSLGIQGGNALRYELSGYFQLKRDVILRDADGFNISGGRTRHLGLEWSLNWAISPRWQVDAVGSWANHEYAFNRTLAQGEQIRSGATIDTAPKHIGSLAVHWLPGPSLRWSLRNEYLGAYPLNAENTADYSGHHVWHAEANVGLNDEWQLLIRARNLLDRRYAERADFAFGNFRYFPGQGRSLFIELHWQDKSE